MTRGKPLLVWEEAYMSNEFVTESVNRSLRGFLFLQSPIWWKSNGFRRRIPSDLTCSNTSVRELKWYQYS